MAKTRSKDARKERPAPPKIVEAGGVAGHRLRTEVVIVAGLAAIAVAVLWPVVTCDFLNHDDPLYVIDNPLVRQGLTFASVGSAFTQIVGYWAPVTLLSHMLDCQLFGLNPAGHHASSLFFHVCNTVVLYLLVRALTKRPWLSALVAALFAMHPQNVETVAWISLRRELLSTLLGLLALLAYVRYAARPGFGRYARVIVLATLSLMAKPALVVTFPAVMLFLDYWPLNRMEGLTFGDRAGRRRFYRLVGEKIPLLAVIFGFVVAGFVALSRYGGIGSFETHPFTVRLANASIAYVLYLWKGLWPTGLAVCYPYPAAISWWKVASALTVLTAITTCAILGRKRFPYAFVGWFWYGILLVPMSGVVAPIANTPRCDHYAYAPMIGLFIAAAWGLDAAESHGRRTGAAIRVAIAAALGAYAMTAHVQTRYWSDSATLFQHALDVTSDNYMAYEFLGKTLADQGRDGEAVAAFTAALRISPDLMEAHNNLGNVQYKQGLYREAAGHFAEALRRSPRDAPILNNLGLALLAQDQCDEAIACFRQAIAAQPYFAQAHNNLGYGLARKGAFEEAVGEYREALRADPNFTLALNNLGHAFADRGEANEAANLFRKVIEIDPKDKFAYYNLADVVAGQGKFEEAIGLYQKALEIVPGNAEIANDLGVAWVRLGRSDDGITWFRKAIEIDPRCSSARLNWGRVLAGQGRYAEACDLFAEALKISPQNAPAQQALEAARRAMQSQGK